jgi:hypothetical protein
MWRILDMAGRPKKGIKEPEKEAVFAKKKLLSMEKYKERVDLLGALLEDGKEYSMAEADALLKKFLNN